MSVITLPAMISGINTKVNGKTPKCKLNAANAMKNVGESG